MNLLAIIFAILPHDSHVASESVDAIEINQYFDGDGKQIFEQHIFRDGGQIIAWRFLKAASWGYHPTVLVMSDEGAVRVIRPVSVLRSWTQYDAEQIEREWLPSEQRRGLRR